MNMKLITDIYALVREILRQPSIAKHNTKRNFFKNILMACFLLMFFGFIVMTEQAILQSQEKQLLFNRVATQKLEIEQLENDLYIKQHATAENTTVDVSEK